MQQLHLGRLRVRLVFSSRYATFVISPLSLDADQHSQVEEKRAMRC